jgi:hypothetical protein
MSCTTRDIVYSASCEHCPAWHVGETSRQPRVRMAEHQAAVRHGHTETSALAQHNAEAHGGGGNQFRFRVIRRGEGFVMRKCYEALHVNSHDPALNRLCPNRGVVPT